MLFVQTLFIYFRFIVKKGIYDVGYLANSILGALVGITGRSLLFLYDGVLFPPRSSHCIVAIHIDCGRNQNRVYKCTKLKKLDSSLT